jgi:hypothetical protein
LTEYPEECHLMTLICLGISQVRNDSSQLITVAIFCLDNIWSHMKSDRKGNAARISRHMVVSPSVATKA